MAKSVSRHDQLLDYAVRISKAILLADWEIVFVPESYQGDDKAEAQIELRNGQVATLAVAPEFWGLPAEYQRRVIVHELCHCYFDRFRISADIIALLPDKNVSALLQEANEDAEDVAVELVARVLSPCLPLPPRFKNA